PSVGPGGSAVSLFTRPMIGIAIRRVFVQKCSTGCAGVARSGACSCMVAARDSQEGVAAMSLAHTRSDATVEECLDELNDIIMGLQSYPPTVLAVALRVHLRSEEHTSELQSLAYLVCRLLLEKKKHNIY